MAYTAHYTDSDITIEIEADTLKDAKAIASSNLMQDSGDLILYAPDGSIHKRLCYGPGYGCDDKPWQWRGWNRKRY